MDKKELKSIARFYKDCEHGFATNDGYYGVPVMGSKTKLAIVHDGIILHYARNEQSARNFITKHKASLRTGQKRVARGQK
tara:strand:+ start:211 stop:450 length:240 start_codon:yes stop_codon:yes gene_type:complete